MRSTDRLSLVALAVVPVVFSFVACGDDTEPVGPGTTSTTTTTSTSNSGGSGAVGAEGGGGSGAVGGTGGDGGVAGSGGGVGGAGGVPANDACPGANVMLALGATVPVDGTLTGAQDDYTTFCGDTTPAADGIDVAYEVDVAAAGTFTMTLDDHVGAGAFDGVLSFRQTQCDARVGTDFCRNIATENETAAFHVQAGKYWVVVDAADTNAGDFTLTLSLAAAVCGDGALNPGEQCDPGMVMLDTCYPPGDPQECQNKPPPVQSLEDCPGIAVPITPPLMAGVWTDIGPYDSTNYQDNHIGSCLGNATGGVDNVYQLTPDTTGTLHLRLGYNPAAVAPDTTWCEVCDPGGGPGYFGCMQGDGCWYQALYVRQGACSGPAATEVACKWDSTLVQYWVDEITVPVTAGQDTWVFVDSYAPQSATFTTGPYFLQARLDP